MVCTPGRVDISNTQTGEQCFLFRRRSKRGHPAFFFSFSQLFNDISIGHTDFKNGGERKTTAKTVTSAALSMLPLKLTTHAFGNTFLPFEKLFISHFQCSGSKRTAHGAWEMCSSWPKFPFSVICFYQVWQVKRFKLLQCGILSQTHRFRIDPQFTVCFDGILYMLIGCRMLFLRQDTPKCVFNVLHKAFSSHVQ